MGVTKVSRANRKRSSTNTDDQLRTNKVGTVVFSFGVNDVQKQLRSTTDDHTGQNALSLGTLLRDTPSPVNPWAPAFVRHLLDGLDKRAYPSLIRVNQVRVCATCVATCARTVVPTTARCGQTARAE
jgi:hypothetical protein